MSRREAFVGDPANGYLVVWKPVEGVYPHNSIHRGKPLPHQPWLWSPVAREWFPYSSLGMQAMGWAEIDARGESIADVQGRIRHGSSAIAGNVLC